MSMRLVRSSPVLWVSTRSREGKLKSHLPCICKKIGTHFTSTSGPINDHTLHPLLRGLPERRAFTIMGSECYRAADLRGIVAGGHFEIGDIWMGAESGAVACVAFKEGFTLVPDFVAVKDNWSREENEKHPEDLVYRLQQTPTRD